MPASPTSRCGRGRTCCCAPSREPWQLADTPLVGYAMYFDLQDSTNKRELALWKIRQVVPPALFALLARDGTGWDAPLMGQPRGDAMLAGCSARSTCASWPMPAQPRNSRDWFRASREVGSNNFAVSGALTRDGRAIVADDMHLGLRAPNIWFRARLRYADARAAGGKVDVSGFTLPGLPAVVVGSNGHVAWGFTNSYIDSADWERLQPCGRPDTWRDGGHCGPLQVHRGNHRSRACAHRCRSRCARRRGGRCSRIDSKGEALALRWSAQLPGSLRLDFADIALAAQRRRCDATRRRDRHSRAEPDAGRSRRPHRLAPARPDSATRGDLPWARRRDRRDAGGGCAFRILQAMDIEHCRRTGA